MKKYSIFIASSIIEYENTRNKIGDFIRKVNDILIDYNIKIKLFLCEFYDNSIDIQRKEDEYLKELRNCDAFFMLIGKNLGSFTKEEYDEAKKSNIKLIYVLFENIKANDEVISFKNTLDKYYVFNSDKDIYYYLSLLIKELIMIDIKVEDNKIYFNERFISW